MKQRPIRSQRMTEIARRLRREMTMPERMLWAMLRGRRLAGLKFRRQQPIGAFVADFVCEQHRLVIEIDGNSHIDGKQQDAARQQFIEQQGYRVLRVGNDDVLRDVESVMMAILRACRMAPDTT